MNNKNWKQKKKNYHSYITWTKISNIMGKFIKNNHPFIIEIWKLCKCVIDDCIPLDLSKGKYESKDKKILIVENFSVLCILKKAYKFLCWKN